MATDVAPLMSSTPRRRIRLRCFIRDQFVRPDITHFLATRALHSKAAGAYGETGGFALAAQTTATSSGAVEPERKMVKRPRSDPAIIHPRFAAWYKLGNTL
jgi:hypothetical protein